jgi:hypothetical protein
LIWRVFASGTTWKNTTAATPVHNAQPSVFSTAALMKAPQDGLNNRKAD